LGVSYWALKLLLSPLFYLLWDVKVEGLENVPASGAGIIAANHQSFCDSLFIPLVVRRKVTYLAKAEYFDSWKTAWFFRAVGQIPIRRGGGTEAEQAILTAKEALAAGRLVAMYPEGTRSLDGKVHRGRTGVARLSRESWVPVIPAGIIGTSEVQPVGSRIMRPGKKVVIRFGTPVSMPPAPDPKDPMVGHHHSVCRAFTDSLMKEIARLAEQEYVDSYVPKREGSGSR
jgi:1-acyl-sn-glycerol-3-phosphate acyltransferase